MPRRMEPSTAFGRTEAWVVDAVRWLRLAIETTGALIIALGLVVALAAFVQALARHRAPGSPGDRYNGVRLTLARHLALALEFQLGADILSTAIAPSWDQIGKLGAIAVIRTALNFFLGREMREEGARAAADAVGRADLPPAARPPGAG